MPKNLFASQTTLKKAKSFFIFDANFIAPHLPFMGNFFKPTHLADSFAEVRDTEVICQYENTSCQLLYALKLIFFPG